MIKCPHCEEIMHQVKKLDVNIDVCPKCMGIWLDKGELDKIVALSNESAPSYDRDPGYQKDRDYDYRKDDDYRYKKDEYYNGKHPRKRRGGIGDIFGDLFD